MQHQMSGASREELLQAWLNMSLMIRGNRMVSALSLNEMVVCRILIERETNGGLPVTATELCQRMCLLKSQINKIVIGMEKRGLIERVRSELDRRKIELRLCGEGRCVYEQEHVRVLKIMEYVCRQLGEEQTETLTVLLDKAVEAIQSMPRAE